MTDDFDNGYDPYNSATTRKTPPIPDWLRNDPELEALAVAMVQNWRRHHVSVVRLWQTRPIDGDRRLVVS